MAAIKTSSTEPGARTAQPQAAKKKPVGGMIIFGILSLSMYIALFGNQEWVTDIFTRGGINTLWPIGTAFAFSFIHGAFASNFLSVLGIEAKKK